MDVLLLVVCGVLGAGVLLIGFASYMGYWKECKVSCKKEAGFHLLFRNYEGEVTQVGAMFEENDKQLMEVPEFVALGNVSPRCFGVYHDNPNKLKDPSKLRVSVGIVLPESLSREQQVKVLEQLKAKGFLEKKISPGEYVYGEWPYRNQLSFWLGPRRFYPAATKFCASEGLPWGSDEDCYQIGIEFYDMEDGKIRFMVPISSGASEWKIHAAPRPEYVETKKGK
uniref:GyrI-like small molecule binding domain-containing protein n=1 Tax=Chromera velia CCMP2878 TaxID=1169474 RepID=A0A0G4GHS8_9ALVE|mmetsp:Transcript_17217/g.34911  ORF Transcript_17217/g.34911 Transcript_17217/m.34911 type:complete len:225 (-) Transcript_17217:483-1157(-)|eukprot:Cvel_21955.t1-p1 / transcript=Cvel_21955.t1 / gene=Cvel_21955 / organism=Chromera_velia_CCMP2878 / gene_product=hypothetical protein / transcript_product=hypothetical protein / location=Cvel_scaffold2108:31656-32327(+) / protein_length=224 / sequence_SO=supercontig / SO=protein_coding / is_pseudo=false